jgi:uncharacterized membrane protein YkgB
MVLIIATQIPVLAYVINTLGAILGLTGALCAIFNPPKLIEFLRRDKDSLLEDTHEESKEKSALTSWLDYHYVLLRALGVIILIASIGVLISIINQLVIRK